MINLLKKEISDLIYKIKCNDTKCKCIDYQICDVMYSILDNIKQYNEDNEDNNTNKEIKKILSYIKNKVYKYIRYFDSDTFEHYNYDEIIKVLEEIDNKLNYVI